MKPKTRDWLAGLFKSIDKKDAAEFAKFLKEDGRFKFGNAPAVIGRANIEKAVAGFFLSIKSLAHQVKNIWEQDDTIICEGEVAYVRLDGKQVIVPFTNIFRMENDLIADYRIYIDIGTLYS